MKKFIGIHDQLFDWALHPSHLYEYGLQLGVSAQQMLENTELNEADLDDIQLKISWHQYKELALNAGRYGSDEWGFELGKRLHVSSHGLLSLLLMNCANWSEIIDLMVELPNLVSPIFFLSKHQSEDYLVLTVHPECTRHPVLAHSMETLFTSLYQLVLQLGGEDASGRSNDLRFMLKAEAPSYHQSMTAFFHNNISWGHHANQIVLKNKLLSRKVPNANPITAKTTRRMLLAQLGRFPATKGYLHELHALFARGIYKQEQCAQQMLTSLPTFKRHLQTACTSFSQELLYFRVEEACWAAVFTDMPVAMIAERLGFRDVNSFCRLFKKQLGVPFKRYRSLHQVQSLLA